MNRRVCFFVLVFSCLALSHALLAETWYVRADGGTRYSVNVPLGQCDGLADAAYPGVGVNQHCAFGDYRYLWDDQSYGNYAWVIAGGDTVIVDNTRQWRVGFDGDGSQTDAWCYGGNGPFNCFNPTIPSGTPLQHTRILGRNYASCSTGGTSNRSAMTQLFGGHGVYTALYLKGAEYVDVECFEITRHSDCMVHGVPAYPSQCSTNVPIDDFDSDGIQTDVNTHDVLLQDLWVHGHPDRGIIGPIGGVVTANRMNVSYNGDSGWDFDDGNGTASVNATLNLSYTTIEWNGCNQEYPMVDTYPAISCYSQSTGGYGDGIGTPAGMAMNVAIDHSIFRYNTQDGEDFGHIDTGASSLSITDSYSYGNNGGQFKWGTHFSSVVFENNLVVGNCLRMSEPLAGAPSTYNTNLADFCRAGSTISFNFVQGETALFANNTIVSYAPTTFDFQCVGSSCSTASLTLTNNIIVGYDNPSTYSIGGQTGGPGLYCGPSCNGTSTVLGTINRYNNSYYGIRGSCQAGVATESLAGTISGETCNDPLFVGEPASFTTEAALDSYVFNLSSGSPARDSGIAVSGLTTDYNGVIRPFPPSLGAMQYVSGLTTPNLSFAAIGSLTYGAAPFAVSATSASNGAISYAITSGPATISGNVVTVTGVGDVVVSANQAATSSYTAATATTTFSVAQGTPSLSFTAIGNLTYGDAPFVVSASSASSAAVAYAVVSGPATITSGLVTLTGAGTVVLSASQAASTDYLAASATTSLNVGQAVPVLSFAAIASQTFGNAPFTVSASSASVGIVTYSVSSGPATIVGSTLTLTGVGTVVLSASQAATTNYLAASATTSFPVAQAVPTLSFAAIANQTFGNPAFSVNASSPSDGVVSYAVASGPATISANLVSLTGTGTVMLVAYQAPTTNYLAGSASTSFTVGPAPALLSFAAIPNQTFGNAPFTVMASSASGGAVTYTVVSGPATIVGNTVSLTGAGVVVLSANQAASGNYAAASVTTSFPVAPAIPILSFATILNQTVGAVPFAVSANSASNGAVTYAVVSGPATISGDVVTVTDIGRVVLSAVQQATPNYAVATATTSFFVASPFTFATGSTTSGGTVTTDPGGTATFNLTLAPGSGGRFQDGVTFIAAGLPQGATATFTPASIAAGSGVTAVALTIQTSSQTAQHAMPFRGWPVAPLSLGLLLMPIFGVRAARRCLLRNSGCLSLIVMLSIGEAMMGLTGCGSGSQASSAAPPAPRTYAVAVTATDQTSGWKSTIDLSFTLE